MKLIIIEGGDRLGKSSLIEGICKHYNYDNVIIRHFGKPPKGMTPEETLTYQFKCFKNEANFLHETRKIFFDKNCGYYDDIVIWNRSHLGEYVYSQMFRGGDPKDLEERILFWENFHLRYPVDDNFEIYLITLTATPEFFLSKEDGQSFSKNLEQKTKELKLFKDVHDLSTIRHKLLINVEGGDGLFRPKEEILNYSLKFITKNEHNF